MTLSSLPPILDSLDAIEVRPLECPRRAQRPGPLRLAQTSREDRPKEAGVGNTLDESYAARRETLEQDFAALPTAGGLAYWQRIEAIEPDNPLALEVLGRCLRERIAVDRRADAERVFASIMGRIQSRTQAWAHHAARLAHSGQPQFAEDLEAESYIALWLKLVDPQPTFLLEHFVYALNRIQQHVASDLLQKAGDVQRRGVAQSARVPTSSIDSLDAPPHTDKQIALAERLSDSTASQEYERAELCDLLTLIERLPEAQRSLINERFFNDRSAEEIAQGEQVTSRTIRNRLAAILKQLRQDYTGGEEDHHGSPA